MSLLLLFAGAGIANPAPPPPTKVIGWPERKKRITVEQLQGILEAQGSPWADELRDTYREAEKRLASPKSKKHKKVLEEVLEEVSERVAAPVDWGPIIVSIQAAVSAARATLALKHAQTALDLLAEWDDEEAILIYAININ